MVKGRGSGVKLACTAGRVRKSLALVDLGLADVAKKAGVGGATFGKMFASLDKAEVSVGGASNLPGVGVFLTVVFPPADRAKAHGGGRCKRLVAAAGTAKLWTHGRLQGGIGSHS